MTHHSPRLRLAIVGAGAIGTAFAFELARAGHDVTVVARTSRLAALRRDGGIVTHDGRRASVTVHERLDVDSAYDLVLVTVLAPQVDALLPTLRESRAQRVMFVFNTFDPIAPLKAAVGVERTTFGFPMGIFSLLKDGRIDHVVRSGTTVERADDAALFSAAGIPTTTTPDMHAWLRSHAALVVGMMSIGVRAFSTQRGARWREADDAARATQQAFALVRALGHPLLPGAVDVMARAPRLVWAAFFFLTSRTPLLRDLGALGPHEPRMLIDQMLALPQAGGAAALAALRP